MNKSNNDIRVINEIVRVDFDAGTKIVVSETTLYNKHNDKLVIRPNGVDFECSIKSSLVDIRCFKLYPDPDTGLRDGKFRPSKRGVNISYDILGRVIKGMIVLYETHFNRPYNKENY